MTPEEHWKKAARLEASSARQMNAEDDYEMIIWSCVHGGAQLANVVLHRRGITAESHDQIHTDVPPIAGDIPRDIADFLAVLESIEKLGPRFIRGFEPIDAAVVRNCLEAYGKLKTAARQALESDEARKA